MSLRARRWLARSLGPRRASRRVLGLTCTALWLLAFAVRSLYSVDLAAATAAHAESGTRMAGRYNDAALDYLAGDGILYPRVWPEPSDTALASRPPGYPLFIAATYRTLGHSFFAVQLVQNALGALLPVALFLLVTPLLGWPVAGMAGLMAAVCAPLAYYCEVITPDSLGALLAVLVLALLWHRRWRPRWSWVAAGLVLGAATWQRPNFVLLAPFLAVGFVLASPRRRAAAPWALAMAAAAALVVAPVTLRNWRVYHAFIPVSINLGIVLRLGIDEARGEGSGAAGLEGRVANWEARRYGDPRYAGWWASPDGIMRDQERVRRSLEIIRAEPLWFAGSVLRRVGRMLDYREGAADIVSTRTATPPEELSPRDAALLLPGRLAAPLRPVLAPCQRLLAAVTLPLLLLGSSALLLLCPRRLLLLSLVPLYQLLTQAALHYEPRMILPMHAFVLVLAAAGLAVGVGGVRSLVRR